VPISASVADQISVLGFQSHASKKMARKETVTVLSSAFFYFEGALIGLAILIFKPNAEIQRLCTERIKHQFAIS
jgi:hypothetical protein